jgi:hypothetical protein
MEKGNTMSTAGVVGATLTAASNALLRSILEEPDEQIRRRKEELGLARLESQIAYDTARADWERQRGALPPTLKTS